MPKNYKVAKILYDPKNLVDKDYNLGVTGSSEEGFKEIFEKIKKSTFNFSRRSVNFSDFPPSAFKHESIYFVDDEKAKKGSLILEYRPFSVKIKHHVSEAKDLLTGDYHCGKVGLYPELNGYNSIFSNNMDKNIASTIAFIKSFPSFGWQDEKIPEIENALIREISHNVGDGEIWYVPLFEIPVHQEKSMKFNFYTPPILCHDDGKIGFYGGTPNLKIAFSLPFHMQGAVFIDGFHGNPYSRFISDVFFDPNDRSSSKCKLFLKSSASEFVANHKITLAIPETASFELDIKELMGTLNPVNEHYFDLRDSRR